MLPAFLTTLFFALSAASAHRTTRLIGSMPANFWRILAGALFLGTWAHLFGGGLGGRALPWFFVSGCIGFGLGDVAFFLALPRLGSRLCVLMTQCLAAPLGALAEWLWMGTTLTIPQMICGTVILLGVATALAPGKHLNVSRKYFLPGILFGFISAFGQGFGAVMSRKAYHVARLAGENINGITAAYQRILGGLLIASIAFAVVKLLLPAHSPEHKHPHPHVHHRAWPWVLLNALAGPTLGVSCYQWALSSTPVGVVLAIVAITPIMVIPLAYLMEGDRPTRRSLIGGAIAVGGAVALAIVKTRPAL